MELNEFADLTEEEFAKRYLMKQKKQDKRFISLFKVAPVNNDVPPTVLLMGGLDTVKDSKDWVKEGLVTEVRTQVPCGSCWSFSTIGATEGLYAQQGNKLTEFSKQQLVDCSKGSKTFPNFGCKGGDMGSALKYIADRGVTTEANYETINNTNDKCLLKDSDEVFKPKGYRQVPTEDSDQLVAAINIRPVSVAIGAYRFAMYKEGIFNNWECFQGINHAMVAVGFGNEDGKLFFRLKNTWGTEWGEKGYMRIDRKAGNGKGICEITQQARYPY